MFCTSTNQKSDTIANLPSRTLSCHHLRITSIKSGNLQLKSCDFWSEAKLINKSSNFWKSGVFDHSLPFVVVVHTFCVIFDNVHFHSTILNSWNSETPWIMNVTMQIIKFLLRCLTMHCFVERVHASTLNKIRL